jgi:hypothetical protein
MNPKNLMSRLSNFFIKKVLKIRFFLSQVSQSRVIKLIKAHLLVAQFSKTFNEKKTIVLTYETAISPPTFGDFLNLVILGRYLILSGKRVKIRIIDTGPRKGIYNLKDSDHRFILKEYLRISNRILGNEETTTIEPLMVLASNEIAFNSRVMFSHAPKVMGILRRWYGWTIPIDFLLSSNKNLKQKPYVTWHLRAGVWDKDRNSNLYDLIQGYTYLRKNFPNYSIMIITAKKDWPRFSKAIKSIHDFLFDNSSKLNILPQPRYGFANTISLILKSEFYYQYNGGGVGTIAHYSNIPYLIIAKNSNYEFNFFGKSYIGLRHPQQKFTRLRRHSF